MKAVLISIQPKWCEMIVIGKKTVEVRKTRPKLDTPFRCYIYCTGSKKKYESFGVTGKPIECGGKVIGEFVCDQFDKFIPTEQGVTFSRFPGLFDTCLSLAELRKYLDGKTGYGWHISDLKIYDDPKELSHFRNPCVEYEKDYPQCGDCEYYHSMGEYPAECACDGQKPLNRPPQSWCYVEEI